MELDERKITILKAIIKTYLETGEPVGSRTISKYTDLKLSSATIRNEMSDLEEMGYILQPHTSAGRIPSDKGYRFYVDQIMQEKEQEVTEIKELMIQRVDRVELVLKKLAQLLATNTNYAALISGPQYHRNKLKFIQLSMMDDRKLLIVTVVEGNLIKNTMVDVPRNISREELQIYTSGATNIFKYPELSDGDRASELLKAFEQKDVLQELITDVNEASDETGIQVYIGNETPVQTMKDCSVVTANYDLGEGIRGTIGIIGPKRMDYEKVLGTLKNLMKQLDATFKNEER